MQEIIYVHGKTNGNKKAMETGEQQSKTSNYCFRAL